MPSHEGKLSEESRKYLKSIILYVKFPFDKAKIRRELEDHISDKIEDLRGRGIDAEEAEKRAVKEMGDAEVIGKALNKEHSPIIGWIWKITNIISVLCVVFILLIYSPSFIKAIFDNPADYIKVENIVYHLKIDKIVKVDDTTIELTDIIYEKDGTLNIVYNYHDKWFRSLNSSLSGINTAHDNSGNSFLLLNRDESWTPVYIKGIYYIKNFNKNSNTLTLTNDNYNRNIRI